MDPRWEIIFNQRKPIHFAELASQLSKLSFSKTFKIIHVVGTNGKGSLSNYIAEGLQENGYKVGLFTSPHIVSANERIQINGNKITDEEFFNIHKLLDQNLHFFAYMYLVALKHFQNNNCDYVVMEAGIGGRNDTTKLVQGEYGVVTSISKDHTEILGDTLVDIAKDKAGIISNNMIFAIPSYLDKELQQIFIDETIKTNASYKIIENNNLKYRERNKKLAKGVLKAFFNIDKKDFKQIKGRTETFVHNGLNTIFDVGHNEDGVKESLKQIDKNFDQVVVAFKDTKDVSEIKNMFAKKDIYYYKVNSHFQDFNEFKEIKDLKSFYKNQNKPTLYIGSFYLIGELWKLKNE